MLLALHVLHVFLSPACAPGNQSYTGLQGLEKHGVGRWREIGAEFLPKWDDQALRGKTARLLGSQSLARYTGWKGDRCQPPQ